jgi:hypothetical protein
MRPLDPLRANPGVTPGVRVYNPSHHMPMLQRCCLRCSKDIDKILGCDMPRFQKCEFCADERHECLPVSSSLQVVCVVVALLESVLLLTAL